MSRLRLLVAPSLLAAAMLGCPGCEDGPSQTFSSAPEGAGNQWNNGNTPPVVPDAGQGFGNTYPTTGANQICSTDLKRERWAWMLSQHIVPPRFYAGIDMAKDDLWHGLHIDDAEQRPADPSQAAGALGWPDSVSADGVTVNPTGGICQSVPLGFAGACPSGIGNCNTNYWGNNGEVIFTWNIATHVVDQMELQLGYLGTMEMKSQDGKDSFIIKIGDAVKKNGQPYLIDWNGNPNRQATECFAAASATFGAKAGIPPIDAVGTCDTDAACKSQVGHPYCISGACTSNCGSDGNCLVNPNSGGTWYLEFRPLVIYMIGNAGVPQPALSTPVLIYNFFSKYEPYGYLPQVMKLDAEGPVATGIPRGARATSPPTCTQRIGQTFGDARTNCIQVHGPAGSPDTFDTVNLNKVLNGLTHDQEHWTANVIGVNQNYTSLAVASDPDKVVLDTDTPQDGDLAQDWYFDLRARGHLGNEYDPVTGGFDMRGSALVYTEWARLMLLDINKQMKKAGMIPASQPPKVLGDPSCTGFDANGNPNFALGCSGIEGLIIPTAANTAKKNFLKDASCANPATCLDPGANWDVVGFYAGFVGSQLKPGANWAIFCQDPGNFGDCYNSLSNSAFFNAHQWVLRLLGKGQINDLPTELRDRRYYFKWFATAFVKYLKAYGAWDKTKRDFWPCSTTIDPACTNGGPGPTDVANTYIDLESLFFDNNEQGGANGFDKFEYIDRDYIGKGQEGTPAAKYNYTPWDFEYGCDLIGGNQRYDNFYRRMDREEIAMFSSMLEDKTHTPGQENNVNLTNLFGSPLLVSVWPSWECATGQPGGDPAANCTDVNGYPLNPPLDSVAGAPDSLGNCPGGGSPFPFKTMVNGVQTMCMTACDFTTYPTSGCASKFQACAVGADYATEGCVSLLMDANGADDLNHPHAKPALWRYHSSWGRSTFGMGHSPIVLHPADKHPGLGVANMTIPNYADGPYTASPLYDVNGNCPTGWTVDGSGRWCNAPLNKGTGQAAPNFASMVPWLEVQPGIGFSFPLDGQHDQVVSTGQLDFTGVLETYVVDYTPWADSVKPNCIADGKCNTGYTCDMNTRACVANDDTIRIQAIESADFLGSVFLCQDPTSGDVLQVHQYDSVLTILDWMAAHPGGYDPNSGQIQPSAQAACQIIVRYSPYNNYIDFVTSKTYGVKLSINQGAGLGRVIDAALYDPSITQTP